MPSFYLPILFILAASPNADPATDSPRSAPMVPKGFKPSTAPDSLPPPTVGTIPAAPRPGQGKGVAVPRPTQAPEMPTSPKAPVVGSVKEPVRTRSAIAPGDPTPPSPPSGRGGKSQPKTNVAAPPEAQPAIDSTTEDLARDEAPKKRGPRSKISVPEREEPVVDRKNVWGQERYAAVVPPALTLSALQQEMNKGARRTLDSGSSANAGSERERLEQLAADIEKAREALRQETARLEALLKASGGCGAGGIGMLMGDPLSGGSAISAAAVRDAPNEQIDSVSKALKGMKPEQGAALLARLDRGLAAEVLRRMKPVDAGSILGLIKPELAAELATEIALRKPAATAKDKEKKGPPK